jgi:superfamily II DNA or RNA helicase
MGAMAFPSSKHLAPVPPPEPTEALKARLAAFPAAIRGRGIRYAEEDRVVSFERRGDDFAGEVRGTHTYGVRWAWDGARWSNACACPMAENCKHAYALAVHFLSEPGPPREPGDWLAALRGTRSPWSRARALRELMAAERRGATVHAHMPPFDAIFEEPDPDLLCWRLAQALPTATGGWLPTALAPYLDRDDLRERMVERKRDEVAARLAAWTERPAAEDARSVRFVLDLRRGTGDAITVVLEGRATTPRLVDERRTPAQLEQLAREAERKPGLLPDEQVDLIEAYTSSLDWNDADGRRVTPTTLRRLLEVGGGTPSVTWSEQLDPELARRFDLVPGAPVELAPAAVEIVPAVEQRDGRWVLDLEARWPDGRSRPLRDAYLMRAPMHGHRRRTGLLLAAGAVHRVTSEPPAELADDLRALGGLPVDPDRHAPLLAELVQGFPGVRASLSPLVRVIAARPFVALDLVDDRWLEVRLLATPPEETWVPGQAIEPGTTLHEYTTAGRWTRVRLETPSPDAHALEILDPAALAPAVEWLARTGALPHEGRRRVRLTPKRLDVFEAAWRVRPEGIGWYATPAARRLLAEGRPLRASLTVRASGVEWFAIEAKWESEDLVLSEDDLALLRRATGNYVRLSGGWVRRDVGEQLERAAEALADLGLEAGAGEQRVSLWQLAQARPESFAALTELADAGSEATAAIAELRARVKEFQGLPRVTVPATFAGELRPYQQTGVDFLAFNGALGLGAVLADDMGLGKTVQALAWLAWLRERTPEMGPALVVCPASVVHNWEREAARFVPGLRVTRLTGSERRAALRDAASHSDLLITNYALLRRDRAQLEAIPFGAVILDEAQNIKNPQAAVSKAACALNAPYRLALTGTPLENRALDLWSILAFTSPSFLGSRGRFTARYDRPDAPPHVRRLLAARLRPVLLRRMKKEVARELPPRTEERRDCELLPLQRKLYADQLARGREILQRLVQSPGDSTHLRFEILAVLTRLRQICCHPALVGASARAPSGKFDALWEILEPLLAEGHKVLLFSQFVQCLKLLETEMKRRDIPSHLLTGQTGERSREAVVQKFTDDERASVFLVSLKAGGTGLNLTAASYVILFDPWWNPAVEAQAIDRTHRIGQTRKVTAYRLLTLGTIEEKIWELQQRKASLAREILGEDGFSRGLTREDLEWLLEPEA